MSAECVPGLVGGVPCAEPLIAQMENPQPPGWEGEGWVSRQAMCFQSACSKSPQGDKHTKHT